MAYRRSARIWPAQTGSPTFCSQDDFNRPVQSDLSDNESLFNFSHASSTSSHSSNGTTNTPTAAGTRDRAASKSAPLPKSIPHQEHPPLFSNKWTRLPELVWIDILLYAAGNPGPGATTWLHSVTRTCRELYPTALRALYKHPGLRTKEKVNKLVATIKSRADAGSRPDVSVMIHSLSLAADTVRHPMQLLSLTPMVQHLEFVRPPFWSSTIRWSYDEFLGALGFRFADKKKTIVSREPTISLCLRSFSWDATYFKHDVRALATFHAADAFKNLRELELIGFVSASSVNPTKFQKPEHRSALEARDMALADDFVAALDRLPRLEHLICRGMACLNVHLLRRLPSAITRLELHDCCEIRSDDLSRYLERNGAGLTHLRLENNQGMDLGFLAALNAFCTRIEELHVSLECTTIRETAYHDGLLHPGFLPVQPDDTMPHGALPISWPRTLRVLRLDNIEDEDWSPELAQKLFASILGSAKDLPMLRSLFIKTSVDIPWRERLFFRELWVNRFRDVFLRPGQGPEPLASPDPKPHTARSQPPKRPPNPRKRKAEEPAAAASTFPVRQSGRLADHKSRRMGNWNRGPDPNGRRCKRLRPNYAEPDSDEFDEDGGDDDGDHHDGRGSDSKSAEKNKGSSIKDPDYMLGHLSPPMCIQGLCHSVVVKIHSQKAAPVQFTAEDFIDGDADDDSDDSDWHADPEDDGY